MPSGRKRFLLLYALITGLAVTCGSQTILAPTKTDSWNLVWSDEFDGPNGSPVDRSKWILETGGEDPLIDYRAADWDRTHVFAANYVYDLPGLSKHFGGAKWLSYVTDHYQLSGVTQLMTGTPVTLNNGYAFNSGAFDGSNMWGVYPYYFSIDGGGNLVTPTVGVPPSRASRDILRSGGMQTWDMSLFKNIPMGERYSIQLRLEAFNAFNHPNFNDKYYSPSANGPWQWTYNTPAGSGSYAPNVTISKNSNWGAPQDTYNPGGGPGGPREVQLGAKFTF